MNITKNHYHRFWLFRPNNLAVFSIKLIVFFYFLVSIDHYFILIETNLRQTDKLSSITDRRLILPGKVLQGVRLIQTVTVQNHESDGFSLKLLSQPCYTVRTKTGTNWTRCWHQRLHFNLVHGSYFSSYWNHFWAKF